MAENKLIDMSMDFAVEVITLCDTIKGPLFSQRPINAFFFKYRS